MLRTAKTNYGIVRGLPGSDPRITSYKGIPFAAPPTGENRWRAPQPLQPWEGILNAYDFAPISFQDTPGGDNIYTMEWHVDPEIPMSEDSLYLNIWTPAKNPDEKLPVLIWIYGGGFQWGYTAEMELDGERIARRGVVVVSISYRLAALGFLAHPQLTQDQPDAPSNFGLLDQMAAIKWVYENIAAFGGDPESIAISGQSAGGASVLSQITCEKNRGILKRAIIFSGMINDPFHDDPIIKPVDIEKSENNGINFFNFMGVDSLEAARKLDVAFIRAKYAEYAMTNPRFAPCIDHIFWSKAPYELYLDGAAGNIPVMSGNTKDEFFTFITADSKEEYIRQIEEMYGDDAGRFLSFPEAGHDGDNRYAKTNVVETSVKTAFMKLGRKPSAPANYYYCFGPDIPGWDNPGCFHSVDLWFWFETLAKCWRPFKGRHYDLAKQMCNYYVNFIKTGNPNGLDDDGSELPHWEPYSRDNRFEMHFLPDGAAAKTDKSDYIDFICSHSGDDRQAFNPYLPSWEFIPDGEPHVFGDRVYVYGSHDHANGLVFCPGDYVCYSAPVTDLKSWRYEGVIYKRDEDPVNRDGHMVLYAPDVTVGPDGRYYLYYVLDKVGFVSVAVCDTPAGKYKFYGYVHYEDGTKLGDREGDEPQFDPGVLTEGELTYLYTGFCGFGDKSRSGAWCTVLGRDMLTIVEAPKLVVPGCMYSAGSTFENHAYFEAASIRKVNGKYYFLYSSQVMHELAYAVSDKPDRDYVYGGVVISNSDIHIDTYKPADKPGVYATNNHGSIVRINGKWYVFYHRHTNGTWFSRQDCAEEITILPDGSIPQVAVSSCGLNGGPLRGEGEYPAYIACNIFDDDIEAAARRFPVPLPKIMLDGKEGDRNPSYIYGITAGHTIGFKFFDCRNIKGLYVTTCGYAGGSFEVRTDMNAAPVGRIKLDYTDVFTRFNGQFNIPDGINAIYLTYVDGGSCSMNSFGFIK